MCKSIFVWYLGDEFATGYGLHIFIFAWDHWHLVIWTSLSDLSFCPSICLYLSICLSLYPLYVFISGTHPDWACFRGLAKRSRLVRLSPAWWRHIPPVQFWLSIPSRFSPTGSRRCKHGHPMSVLRYVRHGMVHTQFCALKLSCGYVRTSTHSLELRRNVYVTMKERYQKIPVFFPHLLHEISVKSRPILWHKGGISRHCLRGG